MEFFSKILCAKFKCLWLNTRLPFEVYLAFDLFRMLIVLVITNCRDK